MSVAPNSPWSWMEWPDFEPEPDEPNGPILCPVCGRWRDPELCVACGDDEFAQ